jgi:hypothetical protein
LTVLRGSHPAKTEFLEHRLPGYRIQDTGYRIQDTGQDTGYRIQGTGYRIQDTGYKIPVLQDEQASSPHRVCEWNNFM